MRMICGDYHRRQSEREGEVAGVAVGPGRAREGKGREGGRKRGGKGSEM